MRPEQLRVVLVEPSIGGNLGSAARAMANLGVSDLRLVNPPADPASDEARRLAKGGLPILQSAKIQTSLESAIADCALVVGTTARPRKHLGRSSSLWDLGPVVAQAVLEGPVALVFGRERIGLTNDELALCSHQITIPTFSEYSSLNLAQAVLVVLYECSRQFEVASETASPRANAGQVEAMKGHLFGVLEKIGYLKTPHQRASLWHSFSELISRAALGPRDVQLLRGIFNRIEVKLGLKPPRSKDS